MQPSNHSKQEINPLSSIIKNWKAIFAFALAGGVFGLAFTYFSKPVYRTRAEIMVSPSGSDVPIGLNVAILSGNNATSLTMLEGLLSSSTIKSALAESLKVPRKEIDKQYVVLIDPVTNVLTLSIDSSDSKMAALGITKAIELAQEYESKVGSDAATVRANQLEKRLISRRAELEAEQLNFAQFIENSKEIGAVNEGDFRDASQNFAQAKLDLQKASSALLKAKSDSILLQKKFQVPTTIELKELQARAVKTQSAFESAKLIYGPDSPELARAKEEAAIAKAMYSKNLQSHMDAERNSITDEISRLQTRKELAEAAVGYYEKLTRKAPSDIARIEFKTKRLRALADSTGDLAVQVEVAKLDSQVDRVRWAVLSESNTDELPVNKRYARTPALAFLCFGIVASGFFYLRKTNQMVKAGK